MRKIFLLGCLLLCSSASRADDDGERARGEVALYSFLNMGVEYEGTGYRQTASGWELKTKPQSMGWGLRVREAINDKWALQVQGLGNVDYFAREDGNTASLNQRQTGQTRLAVRHLMLDVRHPWGGSPTEMIAGLQGAWAEFERRDVVFHGTVEPETAKESLSAAGAYIGLHRGGGPAPGHVGFYWDGELTIGHFFWTDNRRETGGGSIRSGGYSYHFRGELGWQVGALKLGAAFMRESLQILVPGGQALSGGAAASLPINKLDISSPAVAVTYVF